MDTNKTASQIIDALGGTSAVAEMCDLTTGAVSQWRTSPTGIPNAWLKFFRASRPEIFNSHNDQESA
jgi:hypothetical protein